jgi:quinol-cytochrome oxidoreductase complex cytochrome b subunit
MYHHLIRENKTLVSIFLFLIIFGFIQFLKPSFLYNSDGSIREFGVGYKNKTIMPLWLFSIVLGILCYLFILYYLSPTRIFT